MMIIDGVKMCEKCRGVYSSENFKCKHCGEWQLIPIGERNQLLAAFISAQNIMIRLLIGICDLKNYTLPRFTFRDHLRDCFGWLV
jgi:hypothetical protein